VALYGLSLCSKETQIESHTTGALESPIKSKNLQALLQSLLWDTNNKVGATTEATDNAPSTIFSTKKLSKDLLLIL
jgi:hypothetical protein